MLSGQHKNRTNHELCEYPTIAGIFRRKHRGVSPHIFRHLINWSSFSPWNVCVGLSRLCVFDGWKCASHCFSPLTARLLRQSISSFPRIINVNTSHKIIVLIAFFIVMFSNFLCHINLEAVCVRLMRNWVNFVRERIVFALEYFNSFYNGSFYLLEQSNHKPYYLCRFFSLSIKKTTFFFP